MPRSSKNDPWTAIYARAADRYERLEDQDAWLEEHNVEAVFYTYSGLLIHFTQTPHAIDLPARHAAALAEELHAYNLRKCLVPYKGSLFVPLLSWMNLRKIRKAARPR